MPSHIALLRAVNVGGTGKLPMQDLREMCEACGFRRVRTYIASGNAVFEADAQEADIKARLESRLRTYAAKPVGVMVRTGRDMAAIVAANPFASAPGNRVMAIFLDAPPAGDWQSSVTGRDGEELACGMREIYVYYPNGQAATRLKIPSAVAGTARNMNTVGTLAAWACKG